MSTSPAANHWDERYSSEEYVYGTAANEFLVSMASRITGKKVLCIADGEGRNGVFLARKGFDVTSIDFSAKGVEKSKKLAEKYQVKINAIQGNVLTWSYPENEYDAIVSVFAHFNRSEYPELTSKWIRALKPGGHFLLVGYDLSQLGRNSGGPKTLDLLLDLNLVQDCFTSMKVVYLEKGEIELKEGTLHHGYASLIRGFFEKEQPE